MGWRLAPLDAAELPAASERSLPDAATAPCELCDQRPARPLGTVLVIDGPVGVPVPFLICAQCTRALSELHTLLASAARQRETLDGE